MIRALILDYNGVVVNDEPLHKEAFRRVLGNAGIPLEDEEYYTRYLGIPDRDVARDVLRRSGVDAGDLDGEVDHILALKALAYRDLTRRDLPEVPGASRFILEAAEAYPIAIASGAIRVEVEDGLYRLGVRDAITAVVTIEDVARGKPDPGSCARGSSTAPATPSAPPSPRRRSSSWRTPPPASPPRAPPGCTRSASRRRGRGRICGPPTSSWRTWRS